MQCFMKPPPEYIERNFFCRQEAILAAISEKDSHIALLEAAKTKKARDDIERLNNDKQRLNLRLKDLVSIESIVMLTQNERKTLLPY